MQRNSIALEFFLILQKIKFKSAVMPCNANIFEMQYNPIALPSEESTALP